MLSRILLASVFLLFIWPALLRAQSNAGPTAESIEFFEQRIRPVLVKRCYSCHSGQADSIEGGLRLDSRDHLLQGGDRGAAVEINNPEASLLITAIRYASDELQMPPKEAGGQLTAAEIADFEQWIRSGAPFPNAHESNTSPLEQSRLKSRQHWAFQPIGDPQPPAVAASDWVQTEVDAFILAELEKQGLTPSPRADRRTLLKRAKFDLLGLPATFDEIQAFENDPSPDAYAHLIDGYLASPHYGERWGRYWLDVARYADTKGYVYSREERRYVHAHAYRDWVIKAFNDDMPYDQFLIRQIAVDQLQEDSSSLAALGFLTIGRRFINVTPDIIDDRIDVVCRGTMALTVGCARCHDHKYDPIPTKDYYSLYGVFQGSVEKMAPIQVAGFPAPTAEFQQELQARQQSLENSFIAKRDELLDQLRANAPHYLLTVLDVARLPTTEFYMTMGPDEVNPVFVRQWHAYIQNTSSDHPVFAAWHAYAALQPEQFSQAAPQVLPQLVASGVPLNALVVREFTQHVPASMADVAGVYGRLLGDAFQAWKNAVEAAPSAGTDPPTTLPDAAQEQLRQVLYGPDSPIRLPALTPAEAEFFFAEQAREQLGQAQARIEQWIIESDEAPRFALVLEDRPVQQNPHVLIRGNPKNLGEQVPRQFLEILAGPQRRPFQHGSGRLELAQAIANPQNPLTARVMANRVWLHHFGTGLVRTPSDFGLRSDPPTHPQLLDYLARSFMESGWSVKQLHRLIMLSSTYQQASADRPESRAVDADNRWYWRYHVRRLDFETTRDSLLFVSGQLDERVGGRAVDLTSRPFPRRRTLYGYIDRLNLPNMYRSFDFASPDAHSPQRYQTMIPQQALFLMNHPFVVEQAQQLADQPDVQAAPTIEDRIELLYRRVFARSATADEIVLARDWLTQQERDDSTMSPQRTVWQYGWIRRDPAGNCSFAPLPYFNNNMWHAGPQLPELKCDWSSLSASGGNVGYNPGESVVRRWVAPAGGELDIEGTIQHGSDSGDGIHASIVHSRLGELASWNLHKLETSFALKGLQIEAGDTIDFLVDGKQDSAKDEFSWAPKLRMKTQLEGEQEPSVHEWDARVNFSGPSEQPLSAWERFAHVLIQSNEFAVVE